MWFCFVLSFNMFDKVR